MKSVIFWFSGTGNSLAVARDLAAQIKDTELIPIVTAMQGEIPAADRMGVVFPVYAFGAPGIVTDFVRKVPVLPTTYFFSVATMGGWAGGPHGEIDAILKNRGSALAAGWSVAMPGNYTPLYGAQAETTQRGLFEKARHRVAEIAEAILQGKRGMREDTFFPMGWLGGWMHRMWLRRFRQEDQRFLADDKCTHCGLCAKICPVSNLRMEKGNPVWQHRCEQCFTCLQWCPVEAIQYGKVTVGRKRYRHPDSKAADFMFRGM